MDKYKLFIGGKWIKVPEKTQLSALMKNPA